MQKLYRIFGIKRTDSLREMLPQSLIHLYTFLRRALRNEMPIADLWGLHASSLFHHSKFVWRYYAKSFSDVSPWRSA